MAAAAAVKGAKPRLTATGAEEAGQTYGGENCGACGGGGGG